MKMVFVGAIVSGLCAIISGVYAVAAARNAMKIHRSKTKRFAEPLSKAKTVIQINGRRRKM